MIVFHEGLPGAGKSYEACVYHIIPQLKQGRRVLTNIEGINHAKFAELTGIPESFLRQFLICIDHQDEPDDDIKYKKQKQDILDLSGKDALIVIDEIQDMFPSERQKLPVEWSKYIGSHRHDGLDIILMGQSFKDIHTFWRRRVHRKISFTKQTALGSDSSYLWEAFEATKPEVFKKITSGNRKYDKKYFGLYESVTSGTTYTDAYKDKRTVIWNSPVFKWGVPAFFAIAFLSIKFLIGFFTTPNVSVASEFSPTPSPVYLQARHTPTPMPTYEPTPLPSANHLAATQYQSEEQPEYQPLDVFDELANKHRPRLSGVMFTETMFVAQIEILDNSFHRKDVFTASELIDMGWALELRQSGLIATKEDKRYLIRSWPVDRWGRADEGTLNALSSNNRSVGVTSSAPVNHQSRLSQSPRAVLITHSPKQRMPSSKPRRPSDKNRS